MISSCSLLKEWYYCSKQNPATLQNALAVRDKSCWSSYCRLSTNSSLPEVRNSNWQPSSSCAWGFHVGISAGRTCISCPGTLEQRFPAFQHGAGLSWPRGHFSLLCWVSSFFCSCMFILPQTPPAGSLVMSRFQDNKLKFFTGILFLLLGTAHSTLFKDKIEFNQDLNWLDQG